MKGKKMKQKTWAEEMNIDPKRVKEESPDHPKQISIMRLHEERAYRFEQYRRLIALDRYVAAEMLYREHYEQKTREMCDLMNKPLPEGIIERNRERGNYE
jgi:epoxyqueuosine reductase QueG